jgi:DNA polymerase I-like protein with 3'-5' exonuclease and polymerase domains
MKGTRWTSSGGLNVQNWDETLKHVTRFEEEGPPSYWWVAADAAAIEYRIAAWLANIQELLDLFNGETFDEEKEEWKKYDPRYDAHSLVAVEVFGDMFTNGNMKLKKALRTMVKRVVYALFYGAYPEKIFQTILEDKRVPSEFRAFIAKHKDYIERIHSGFSSRFGEWERYAQRQIAQVRFKEEQIIAPFGRHRPWALSNMVEETKIRNTPIQLSAGEIINDIFIMTDKALRAAGVDAHFSIHEHDSEKYVVHARDVVKAQGIMNDEFDRWLEFGGDDEIVRKIHIYGQAHTGLSLASV